MLTKRFHLGDDLSVTTGRLLSPAGMPGIYAILKHLTGESIFTHQIGRVLGEAATHVLAQFPALAAETGDDMTPEGHSLWLVEKSRTYGEWFDVAQLPAHAHESSDRASSTSSAETAMGRLVDRLAAAQQLPIGSLRARELPAAGLACGVSVWRIDRAG